MCDCVYAHVHVYVCVHAYVCIYVSFNMKYGVKYLNILIDCGSLFKYLNAELMEIVITLLIWNIEL